MPTTVNSRNGNEPTNKSKKGRNLQQPPLLPCPNHRNITTSAVPPALPRTRVILPAENQRRPRTHYLCYRIGHDLRRHQAGLRQARRCVPRAAYHHEPVATDYKVDGELICAEVPRLALCLSGTPSQLANFIRSLENGLYCRFGIYTCGARWKYRSAAPIKGQEDYITLYKGFGKEVLEMYFFFQQSPNPEVTLSDRQWEEHTAYFDCLLNEVASEQADAPGWLYRTPWRTDGGLRIASIFTALRKYEGAMHMKEYICTDEDFHASMQIVQTILNHSLLVASSLPGEKMKPQPMQSYFRIRSVVESLPKTFTYKQIKEKALTEGISERSTCRYLKNLIELKYIEKQTDKYIRMKEFTDK